MVDPAVGRQWVARVLGITAAPSSDGLDGLDDFNLDDEPVEPEPVDPLALWSSAKDDVDAGLNALVRMLKDQDSPVLRKIADYGLHGLTDGQTVALTKALMQYRGASGEARAAASGQVLKAVTAYQTLLTGNPVFARLDANPFGVSIGLVSRLGGALADIGKAVS
jgi:hypothetical protein